MTPQPSSGRDTAWIKASRSTSGGDCVEMRRHSASVEVRDSKNLHGPVLSFSPRQFAAWLEGADNGEYGHLTA